MGVLIMAENEMESKKVNHPAIRTFDNEKTYIAKTGAFKGAINRYEIIWPVPQTDEEAMERYNCNLSKIIELGIQIFSHAPDYASLFDGKDQYSVELHQGLQDLADAQKAGMRKTGKSAQMKAEAVVGRKAIESANALGFTNQEEMYDWIEKNKKKMKK